MKNTIYKDFIVKYIIFSVSYSLIVSVYAIVMNNINIDVRFSVVLITLTVFISMATFVISLLFIVNCIRHKNFDRILLGVFLLIISVYELFLYGGLSLSGVF